MAKEKSKDKSGTLGGLSKSANNNRGIDGKAQDSDSTTSRAKENTGHIER